MTINVTGPDGSTFEFPDSTTADIVKGAMAKHYGAPADSPEGNLSATNVARSFSGGVPVVGGLLNRMDAATNAALAPALNPLFKPEDQLKGKTFAERQAESLALQQAKDRAFQTQHPYVSAGAGAAGAVASTLPLMATPAGAAAFGVTGKVVPATIRAAETGGGIGLADAITRGEDPTTGAVRGALGGAGGALAGRAVGAGYDAFRRAGTPAVPNRFVDVNGRPIPVRESVVTGSPDTSRTEQALLRSGQPSALAGEQATADAMAAAHSDLSAGLDPTGVSPGTTPLEAGNAAARDLVALEQQRAAAEVQRMQGVTNQTSALRSDMEPIGPQQRPIPTTPTGAGQAISEGIAARQGAARAATQAAYEARNAVPGEFSAGRLLGAGQDIRMRLNNAPGEQRVRISPEVTPTASNALQVIDDEIAGLRFTNEAAQGQRPITPADMDQVRKQLVILRRQANMAARTTGNWEDARAMGRVMNEFDDYVGRVARAPAGPTRPAGFSGDPEQYLAADAAARAQHARERAAFSRAGAGDKVGTFVENVLGKYPGQEMPPDKIISTVLGSPDRPGGVEQSVAILNRLRNVLGVSSPEWAALRRATISHFTEAAPGEAAVPATRQAERILGFLGDEAHSGALFNPSERARLAAHAQRLRGAEDPLPLRGTTDQKIAVLSGRHTGEAATGEQVLAAIKADPRLAEAVRNNVSPQSWSLIKQGLWKEISEAPEGMTAWGPQKIGERIAKFLKSELAQTVFTADERAKMSALASLHHQLVPVPGTTNPSGTAHMVAKLMSGNKRHLLGMLGFSHGGLAGYSMGEALGRALEWGGQRMQAREATRLFMGPQPSLPASIAAQRAQRAITLAAQSPALRGN